MSIWISDTGFCKYSSSSRFQELTPYGHSFVQRVSPNVLKAFIYIWQPDGLDAFSDYIRGRYGFADREGSEYSPWTTMITISHWQLRPKEFPDTLSTLFDEGRLSGLIPPEMLSEAVGTAATSVSSGYIRLK